MSLTRSTSKSWQAHLDVDLRAPVFLTQAFAKPLAERREPAT